MPVGVRFPARILPELSNIIDNILEPKKRVTMLIEKMLHEPNQNVQFDFLLYLLLEIKNHRTPSAVAGVYSVRLHNWHTLQYRPDCSLRDSTFEPRKRSEYTNKDQSYSRSRRQISGRVSLPW